MKKMMRRIVVPKIWSLMRFKYFTEVLGTLSRPDFSDNVAPSAIRESSKRKLSCLSRSPRLSLVLLLTSFV